eukprot:scaffold34609_cov146-Amphora_coffeaeformis.AAC.4
MGMETVVFQQAQRKRAKGGPKKEQTQQSVATNTQTHTRWLSRADDLMAREWGLDGCADTVK